VEPIRVLLADDHPLIRAGLRAGLAAEPDFALVGEAADGHDALRLCREHRPDVLLLDLQMPGPSAVETVTAVHECCPGVRVLMLTAHSEAVYVRGLVAAGVAGYVLKDEAAELLVDAIRSVARGGTWFSRPVVAKLVQPHVPRATQEPSLTRRERQVLPLLAQGWDNARIASTLYLSEQTVRNYVSRLYAKLGVSSRAQAMAWAQRHGYGDA
jgi:DNA-binding NarL/FixJ family response regulator